MLIDAPAVGLQLTFEALRSVGEISCVRPELKPKKVAMLKIRTKSQIETRLPDISW